VREALATIGARRPILVGFSWGGSVAIAYALDHPAEVAGVVTVGSPYTDWETPVHVAYRLPTWPVIGPAFTYGLAPLAGRALGGAWSAPAFAPEAPPPSFATSPWWLAARSASYLANAEDIRELKPFLRAQKARYAGLRVPVEILHGAGDGVVSAAIHAEPAAAALPMARLHLIEGAGHMIPYTRPELVAEAIRRVAGR
jgi:pimeloyl-ACP methyl ester carboxylesterase